jgi:hypothetical protein
MTTSIRLLETIRDAADAFGTAQPADLLKNARMKRNALVRAVGDLAGRGLVEIDRETGAVSLTVGGRAELFAHAPTLAPNVGRPYRSAGHALAPGLASAPQPAAPVDRPAMPRGAGMTAAAARAAVTQTKDTAIAVIKRQAAKKATKAAPKSSAKSASRPRERAGSLEPMTAAAMPAIRPKRAVRKARSKKAAAKRPPARRSGPGRKGT